MGVRGKRAPVIAGQTGPVIEVDTSGPSERQPLDIPNVSGLVGDVPDEIQDRVGVFSAGLLEESTPPPKTVREELKEMKDRLREVEKAKDTEGQEQTQSRTGTPDPKEPFPNPPSSYVVDKPERFFAYWKGLEQRFLDRAVVYVYRTHPVINKLICPQCMALQEPKKGNAPYKCMKCNWSGNLTRYIDKLVQPIDVSSVLANYGSGQYEFIMVDSSKSTTVMRARVTTVTDYNAYPPSMEDYKHVDVHAPSNRSYVQWARMKGIKFPQLAEKEEEEENEMARAQVEMITPLTETIQRMTSQIMDEKKEGGKSNKTSEEAVAAGIELVAKASARSQEIIAKGYEQAAGLSGTKKDPMEDIRGVFGLLKDSGVIGKTTVNTGTEVVQQLVPLLNGMMQRESDLMRAQLELNQRIIQETAAKNKELEGRVFELLLQQRKETAPPTLTEKMEEWEKMKKLFGGGGRSSGGEDTEDKPTWERMLEKLLPLALVALPTILAQGRGPGAPGTSVAQNQAPPTDMPSPSAGVASTPAATTNYNQNQGADSMIFNPQQQLMDTFREIEPRIVDELKKEYPDGISFCQGFKQWVPMGSVKHMMLKQLGIPTIKGALEMYGSDELKAIMSMDPTRFDRFLWEFLNPEEAEEQYSKAEEEATEQGNPQKPS